MINVDVSLVCFDDLPDIKQDFNYTNRKNCIGLIPVFFDAYTRPINVHAFIKAAIHSRRTCLIKSDAIKEEVAIKLYMEDGLQGIAQNALESNGIDVDKDIIWFKAAPLPDTEKGRWGHLGKQMIPYWDDRFAEYDWIAVWDADVFWFRKNEFFKKLKEHKKQIGYIGKQTHFQIEKTLEQDTELGGIPVNDLMIKAGVNVGHVLKAHDMKKARGHLWVYPAKYFHKNCKDFVYWMWDYAPYFGNDEILSLFWTQLFDLDFFSIAEDFGMNTNKITDLKRGREAVDSFVFHGKANPYNDKTKEFFWKLLGLENETHTEQLDKTDTDKKRIRQSPSAV